MAFGLPLADEWSDLPRQVHHGMQLVGEEAEKSLQQEESRTTGRRRSLVGDCFAVFDLVYGGWSLGVV